MLSRLLFLAGLAAFARSLIRYDQDNPEPSLVAEFAPTNEFEQRLAAVEG